MKLEKDLLEDMREKPRLLVDLIHIFDIWNPSPDIKALLLETQARTVREIHSHYDQPNHGPSNNPRDVLIFYITSDSSEEVRNYLQKSATLIIPLPDVHDLLVRAIQKESWAAIGHFVEFRLISDKHKLTELSFYALVRNLNELC